MFLVGSLDEDGGLPCDLLEKIIPSLGTRKRISLLACRFNLFIIRIIVALIKKSVKAFSENFHQGRFGT